MEIESLKGILSEREFEFLKDLKSVVERQISDDQSTDLTALVKKDFEVLKKIVIVAENLCTIIEQLKKAEEKRLEFVEKYPEWVNVYKECIDKLREIAKIIEKDKFNCNVSKVVGNCTSFVGNSLTVTSAALIPATAGLSTPFFIAGAVMTLIGSITSFGTSVTENVRANKLIKEAQKLVEDNEQFFEAMSDYLEHGIKLKKAQSEVLKIDILKDVIPCIKDFVGKGMKIKDRPKRLKYIEKNVPKIIKQLRKDVAETIPQIAVITVVSLLSAIFVSMWDKDNQFTLEQKAMHIKSFLEILSLSDEIFDWMNIINGEAGVARGVTKIAGRATIGAIGLAIDGGSIAYTSYQIHKGSPSSHAKKIATAADELEKEMEILQELRGNLD